MTTDGLLQGEITDEVVERMRRRIGYPNQTVRNGVITTPWNVFATQDAFRRFSSCIGDDNPLYVDPEYPAQTRWKAAVAPPGFEMSLGVERHPEIPEDLDRETRSALRGVHLFHSGGETFYYDPIREGMKIFTSRWIADVRDKKSEFAGRSVIVTNGTSWWNENDVVVADGVDWFVHTERQRGAESTKYQKDEPAWYSDEQLDEIDAAYENEYRRGKDTLFLEDVKVGQKLPRMVKGPMTITDLIGAFMAAGWYIYGSWPWRLAYLNRTRHLRGFYTRNEFNAWDSVQRLHWDPNLARQVGVPAAYDIGPMRKAMLAHYCSNYAGDDCWVYRLRYEFRRFNYMGDVTWIDAEITDARVDEKLGPLIDISISGTNQRGHEHMRGTATILVASREHGLPKTPTPPPPTPHRS